MRDPQEISTMDELRIEIDALDAALIALLADRTRLVARAAEIKLGAGLPARIPARVEDVVAKVVARAGAAGVDPGLAEVLWREMIEHFIAQEERVLGKGEGA
ncbi:MAG: chorismate mutase [Sphingomonadales bacterium]|nr:chorismate mutase [Sphingomonadales bacterium]